MDKTNEFQGLVTQKMSVAFVSRATLPLIIVLLIGVIQSFRFGINNSDYLLLIIGALTSFIAMFFYGVIITLYASNPKRKFWWIIIADLFGVLPLFFAGYLFFYRGIFFSIKNFISLSIISGIVFIILGYWFSKNLLKLIEINEFLIKLNAEKKQSKSTNQSLHKKRNP
ncbi:MAG: hypothetical protein WC304_03500 [Candidatus Gracilibacteria bacterium]|jgi:uncharacterized protein YacL